MLCREESKKKKKKIKNKVSTQHHNLFSKIGKHKLGTSSNTGGGRRTHESEAKKFLPNQFEFSKNH